MSITAVLKHAAGILLVVSASMAVAAGQPSECGDIDGNGTVTSSDALMVLRKAVGLPVAYQCELMPTTTTTEEIFSDCNSNSDCEDVTGRTICCAYACSQCEHNEDCPEGQYCSSGCDCLPIPTTATSTTAAPTAAAGTPSECGDIDGNGSVTSRDALLVLHKAVGLPIEHNCDAGITTTTTTSTTTNTMDQCYTDADCEAYVGPGLHCGGPTGYDCVECEFNYHCQPGEECVYFKCVPSGQ